VSWFFRFGNVFFSVALITAVVAMCTHQVNRGLILLLSSFCAIALCAFVFFALVVARSGWRPLLRSGKRSNRPVI
jgi:hypothetical protein